MFIPTTPLHFYILKRGQKAPKKHPFLIRNVGVSTVLLVFYFFLF